MKRIGYLFDKVCDENGQPLIDVNGKPVMGWVKHITFSGSKTLAQDMADLDLSEPV